MTSAKPRLLACLCCRARIIHERGAYEICPRCGWEDDPVQAKDKEFRGGANKLSLTQARARWVERKRGS